MIPRGGHRATAALIHWLLKLLVQSLWKTIWQYLLQLKRHMPYNPTIPLLSIQLGNVTAKLFVAANNWKQFKCQPALEWINKSWNSHIVDYCMAVKMNELLLQSWMCNMDNLTCIVSITEEDTEEYFYKVKNPNNNNSIHTHIYTQK